MDKTADEVKVDTIEYKNNSSEEKVQYSSDKFNVYFPSKEEFMVNNNRFYTIVCRTERIN